METPLLGNWRKEDDTSSEVVDTTVYRKLVGSVMYLVNTRPDTFYVVNHLSQAMAKPAKIFWKVGRYVLRYLRGNTKYELCHRWIEGVKLESFTNIDWADSP